MRKQPIQKRAQLTIEAIFQATAQLVEREGMAGLTTNKIAAKAGFSVGTLYQYFASKDEIFRAMVQYSRETVLKELSSYLYRIETKTDASDIDPKFFSGITSGFVSKALPSAMKTSKLLTVCAGWWKHPRKPLTP